MLNKEFANNNNKINFDDIENKAKNNKTRNFFCAKR